MAARKIKNQPAGLAYTPIAIYYDSEYSEYQVKIKGQPDATYYTNDKDDAFATAQLMRNSLLKQNPAPKRKTAARTQRAAVGYVNRPSQITKKAPSNRLKKRRTINLQTPRGVFPNPSKRHSGHKAVYTVLKWTREKNTTSGNPVFSFLLESTNATRFQGKTKPNSGFVFGLPFLYPGDKITAILETTPSGRLYMTDAEVEPRNNPDSVHFDIDVNSHNARGAKAKTRVNPSARKKQIVVEYELSGQKFAIRNRGMYGWKELATFPDTPEGSENAIQYAQAYHNLAPHLRIQVVTK